MKLPCLSRSFLYHLVFALLAAAAVGSGAGCGGRFGSTPPGGNAHTVMPSVSGDSNPNSKLQNSNSQTPPVFTDVTETAGMRFQHRNFHTPNKFMLETMCGGGGFIDYDGDGYLDIILLNEMPLTGSKDRGPATLKLYHNNHNGTFTDVTRESGMDKNQMYAMGVAVGDFDNDGYDDIYISAVLGPGHLFHNERGGQGLGARGQEVALNSGPRPLAPGPSTIFRDVTAQAGVGNPGKWGTSCAWVDYDNDGRLDLFVCNYVKYTSLKDDQPCFAGLKHRIYCIPAAYETSSCTLYHNEGGGKFRDVTGPSGVGKATARGKALGISVWDYDDDGLPDLFIACDTVPGFLLHNKGNGMFEDGGMSAGVALDEDGNAHSGMGIDTADTGNDGTVRLAITNYQGQQTSFYKQGTDGLFQDVHRAAGLSEPTGRVLGFGLRFFDYDNDGWQDIIQVNGHVQDDIAEREATTRFAQPTLLFRNRRDGTFEEVGLKSGKPFSIPLVGRGLAVGDFDNDGRLDLLAMNNNGPAHLWHNETPAAGSHWLTLKLIGTKSNRDGIGARLRVTSGGTTQRDMVRSGSSYLSASDLRAHFGLGAQTSADVEIRWPSGTVDKIAGIGADRIVTVREGAGKAE